MAETRPEMSGLYMIGTRKRSGSDVSLLPVITTTGIRPQRSLLPSTATSWDPESSGITRSVMMAAGIVHSSEARRPSARLKRIGLNPASLRMSASRARKSGSSSTTKMTSPVSWFSGGFDSPSFLALVFGGAAAPITFGGVFAFAVLLMLKAGHGGSSTSATRTHSLQREGGQSSPPARIATFSETLQPFQERTAARRRPRRATADQADRSPAARSIGRRQCPSPGEEDGEVRLSALVVAERRPAGGEQVRVLGEV